MKQPAIPEAVEQLIEKLNHPLDEIRERAMRTLALKLQGHLVSRVDIISKYPQTIGTVLLWINSKQKVAKPESLLTAIQILSSFAEDEEGRQVECKYGCVEFFSEYRKHCPAFLAKPIDALITALLKTRRYVNVPAGTGTGTKSEPAGRAPEKSSVSATTRQKEEPASATPAEEGCEFPFVELSETEEKMLFDANVVIRYGDAGAAINMCEQLDMMLEDYPVECLLQRSDLIKSLLFRLENEKDFAFHHFAVPVLMKIVARLRTVYRLYLTNFSRPSELPLVEKIEHKLARAYLEATYPAVLSSKYDKPAAANKLCLDSMSHLSALGFILQKCIKAMKDRNKLGSLVLLYQSTLSAVFANYTVAQSPRLLKEVFVPACNGFVETIQTLGVAQVCADPLLHPVLHACANLCQFMDDRSLPVCRKAVPKFFSAVEEAAYYDCFEPKHLICVKKAMDADTLESMKKTEEITRALEETGKYQQTKRASALTQKDGTIIIESREDVEEALAYLGRLAVCLEFYSSEKGSLLEEVTLKCVKALAEPGMDADGSLRDELVKRFTGVFSSPHEAHKLRLLKAILSDIKASLGAVRSAKEMMRESAIANFCSLPAVVEVECIIRGSADMQVTYFQMLVLLLDEEGCGTGARGRYTKYLGLMQGLSTRYGELNRLIAKIEQTDAWARNLRVLRDLFSLDEEKRRFATLAFRQRVATSGTDMMLVDDLTKGAGVDAEEVSKLGRMNAMQVNEFDVRNLFSLVVQPDNLDFAIKKSALEQINFYLTDSQR